MLSYLLDGAYKRSLAANQNLSLTEEPAKARDRRALQQLALNVHVKHSDLTCKSKRVSREVGSSLAI